VPDSLHIHAYPFISALNIPDFVNHESPANGLIKDRRLPDDLANCHAEGRGFESLQPLRIAEPFPAIPASGSSDESGFTRNLCATSDCAAPRSQYPQGPFNRPARHLLLLAACQN
jgi:hypothetical protein